MTFCLNDLETFTKLQKLASYETTADKSASFSLGLSILGRIKKKSRLSTGFFYL